MLRGWMGPALLGLGLTAGLAAAQTPYGPDQGTLESMVDPIPYINAPSAGVPPLPTDHSSPYSSPAGAARAWDNGSASAGHGWLYGGAGYMAMQRQRLGHGAAAVLDTASGGVDTGNPPPAGAAEAADFHDLHMNWNNGLRATLGYFCDGQALELSGFYLFQNSSAKTYADPGRLDTFFNVGGNFTSAPLGFEGDNGLWLQADVIRLRLQTALGNAEVNYRRWLGPDSCFNWLVGIRYLDLYERFGLYTGDDDLTVLGTNGRPDPTKEATYYVTAHNQILAPQLGFEWTRGLTGWLAFTMSAKGAWGVNFLTVDVNLKRGDGFLGLHNGRSQTLFSHLYETGFFLDFLPWERARLRAGYNLMWVVDVAEALGQFDYNLAHTSGRTKDNQSIFYHGPLVELSFLF